MMGTRAAAFAGKIPMLREMMLRIQNGTLPLPTCVDIANMLKYFCQVFHDFKGFKDIENIPLYASEKRDRSELTKTLPNFDYSGLYKSLNHLVDVLPLIPLQSTGLDQLGANLLMLLKCLAPFLDQTDMETMPYLVTTLFMSLPPNLHKDILDTLCFNLLPLTIDQQQKHTASMIRRAKLQRERLSRQRMQQINIPTNITNSQKQQQQQPKGPTKKPPHCVVRIEESTNQDKTTYMDSLGEDQGIVMIDEDPQDVVRDANDSGEIGDDIGDILIDEGEEYAMLSVTSILMIAFHYITEPMYHSQLVECLMKLKSNVFEDLLFVIAYGTTRARCPAVEILFRYWPDICPNQQDRKNNSQTNKLKHVPWQPTKCQNKNCNFTTLEDDGALKMCLDFKISIELSGLPPPMLVCMDCFHSILGQQLVSGYIGGTDDSMTIGEGGIGSSGGRSSVQAIDDYGNKFIDLLLPLEKISKLCENKKDCRSKSDKSAIGTCFDIVCCGNYNSMRPIRYCRDCFIEIHEAFEAQNHIRHSSIRLNIMDNKESINNFVEAIISLLKEAAPVDRPSKDSERYLRSLMGPTSQFNTDNKDPNIATEEKQLISQYGIWLMTGLCKSVEALSNELLGRLLGMLFQWFHFTACLPDDQAGSALEKLKGECIKGWIMSVKNQRLDVFISCLLPHPIDCSKIGGHWEVWPDAAHQIKEGFKRLLCLVPYDIITDDVWDEIMPYWMECFRHEVPENELNELKILLSKVFDPELSPLGFETKQMYHFISSRFEDTNNTNQEQTLYWLQIITMLEIPIPIDFLFQMMKSGVKTLALIRENELNQLKMNERLNDMDKMANDQYPSDSKQKLMTQSPSNGSIISHDSSNGSSPGRALSISGAEDDVMLPDSKENYDSQSGSIRKSIQQQRQAQARAAFSAKLLQQASILDAQHSGEDTNISQSSTHTHLDQLQAGRQANMSASVSASGLHTPQSNLGMAVTSGSHSQPLKSIASSVMASQRSKKGAEEAVAAKAGNHRSHAGRPKLKLNLSSTEESLTSSIDNNMLCYILMMDILLKQLELQEISSHRGLDGKEPQQAIELLNAIIQTPWIGRHTCCDSLPNSSSSPTFGGGASSGRTGPSATSSSGLTVGSKVRSDSGSRQDSVDRGGEKTMPNVHSYGHCAQGFETEDSFETCVFCEIISMFHQLSMSLLEFFSPVIEVSICEVSQEATNGEFDGRPDYSRIGLDHLGPSPKENREFEFDTPANWQKLQIHQDPTSPFSPTYCGPTLRPEVLESLPNELQLTYNLLVQFHRYQTPDIVSQVLQMIKLMSLHSQVLSRASKTAPQFISWCQHNMLVNKLWSLCQLESSEIARTCVPLLLHCITLPWGVRLFRDLVERDFNSDQWLSRFRAVERVVTIAYFCEPSTIKNSTILQSTIASAFCYVVRCLDDIEAIVAQRALVSLEMMKTSSLKLLLWCLEVQFDCITIDRPMILRSVFQLYNHLRDRRFLTWDFFLNRFDAIFLEAQIYLQQTGEIPSFTMQDLKNTNTKSEIYQKKIIRAREALLEVHHSRALSSRFNEKAFRTSCLNPNEDMSQEYKESLRLQQKLQPPKSNEMLIDQNLGEGTSGSGLASQKSVATKRRPASPLRRVMQHGKSTSSRYQSVAFLTSQSLVKRKNSKLMTNLAMQSVLPMMLPDKLHQHLPNSFVDDGSKLNEMAQENHVFGVVHRICDEDRDTNHSLIFLLMQFFSKPDSSHPQSSKTLNRSHQIVLRHLNILMGYSIARKNFLISASNLRLLPVFNAFLTSLPKVLDFNYSLGTILPDTFLPVLIYCPAPDNYHYDSMKNPTYSLWLLNPMVRQSWLMSVMTFLYKYQFGEPHLKDHVNMLMWIVVNTLESHLNCSAMEISQQHQADKLVNIREPREDGSGGGNATSDEALVVGALTRAEENNALLKLDYPAAIVVDLAKPKSDSTKIEVAEITATPTIDSPAKVKPASQATPAIPNPTESSGRLIRERSLTKADTSDSLNVKGKLFYRKLDIAKSSGDRGNKVTSAGSSSTRLNMEPLQPEVVVEPRELARQLKGEKMAISQGGDERLLPIGHHSPSSYKSRSVGEQQPTAAERLLPIGPPGAQHSKPLSTVSGGSGGVGGGSSSSGSSSSNTNTRKSQEDVTIKLAKVQQPTGSRVSGLKQQETSASTKVVASPVPPATGSGQQSPIPNIHSMSSKASAIFGSKGHGINKENSEHELTPVTSPAAVGKNNKKRFGVGGKQQTMDAKQVSAKSTELLGGEDSGKSSNFNTGSSSSIGLVGKKGKNNKFVAKDYQPPTKQFSAMKPSFSSPSLLNEQLAQINRHSILQEFSDKDLSMCLVILETFIHHEPSMAAHMLPNILRLVARYSSNLDSWQSGSNVHMVGGSMFVARQFIRVALHDLMDNNIFHQIFTSHFTGYEFYKSMATSLADFADLNQLAPLSKLFEDLNKQKNLPETPTLITMLENVATYFECVIAESTTHSQTTWNSFILNWENFLRKLILNLSRYSGSTIATNTTVIPVKDSMSSGGVLNKSSDNPGVANAGNNSNAPNIQVNNQRVASGSETNLGGAVNFSGQLNPVQSSSSLIMTPIMRIILSTTKISHLASCKTIVDPYSKIISYTALNSHFNYEHLLEINHNCCRLYTRDRDKYLIQRTIAYELTQVLRFRFFILEENLLKLLLFVLQDVGGTLAPKVVEDGLKISQATLNQTETYITNVSECLRQYISDLLDFITDVHAISRINDNLIGSQPSSINRDSFGGHVKAAISQYLALEMSLNNGGDNRTILRYLPRLYSSPSLQQGPREFIDCISHIRQLSWIILGSLQHSTLTRNRHLGHSNSTGATGSSHQSSAHVTCQPIPLEKNGNIAEHVQVILAGFAEQSKESVTHMSGLFHAFLLCQLWTMYCEIMCNQHPANSEQYQFCQSTLDDFWAKITPGVLRLVGHSRVMSEMVGTHFLQLIESLIESNSSILIRYLPMWNSVFYSYKRRNKSGNLAIRLQKCTEWQPPDLNEQDFDQNNKRFNNWLEKVQYKMSHIEIQSSQAAPFYFT